MMLCVVKEVPIRIKLHTITILCIFVCTRDLRDYFIIAVLAVVVAGVVRWSLAESAMCTERLTSNDFTFVYYYYYRRYVCVRVMLNVCTVRWCSTCLLLTVWITRARATASAFDLLRAMRVSAAVWKRRTHAHTCTTGCIIINCP